MPSAPVALIAGGASLIGGSMQSSAARSAASTAAGAQTQAAELGIEEQRRQFDEITKLLSPYVQAGEAALPGFQPFQQAGVTAFDQQQALSGLLGPERQQAAISQLEQAPEFQALTRQGEEALLQRASATGGLRGGNIQAALAQFRPQMLSQQIERQLGRLSGFSATGLGVTGELASMGQAAAARQAAAGAGTGQAIAGLLGQQGQARAGAALAGGTSPFGQFLSAAPSMIGTYYGMTGQSPFSFGRSGVPSSTIAAANLSSDPLGTLIQSGAF
jgi:hypothetical protein